MPKREVIQSITLFRDGKRVTAQPGQIVDFTDEELDQIIRSNPNAVSKNTTVNLDDVAEDGLVKTDLELSASENSAPDASGGASKAAPKAKGRKGAAEDL